MTGGNNFSKEIGFEDGSAYNYTMGDNSSSVATFQIIGTMKGLIDAEKGLLVVADLVIGFVLLVYLLIWKQQNIHGRTMGSLTLSMFLYYVTLTMALFEIFSVGSGSCVANAAIFHFGILAMYCWLAVLNFDMWNSLSSMIAVCQRKKGNKRFAAFCLAAFGVPFLTVTVSLCMQYWHSWDDDEEVNYTDYKFKLPMYGSLYCVLRLESYVYYALGVILLAFLLSVTFGNLTVNALDKFKRETARVHAGAISNAARNECMLVMKLYVIMGTIWGLEPYSMFRLRNSSYYTLGAAILGLLVSLTFASMTARALIQFRREISRLKNVDPTYVSTIKSICAIVLLFFFISGATYAVEIVLISIYGDEICRWFGVVMATYHCLVSLLFFRMFMVKREILEQLCNVVPYLGLFVDWVDDQRGYVSKSKMYSSSSAAAKTKLTDASTTFTNSNTFN